MFSTLFKDALAHGTAPDAKSYVARFAGREKAELSHGAPPTRG